jgi:hypothetical protein
MKNLLARFFSWKQDPDEGYYRYVQDLMSNELEIKGPYPSKPTALGGLDHICMPFRRLSVKYQKAAPKWSKPLEDGERQWLWGEKGEILDGTGSSKSIPSCTLVCHRLRASKETRKASACSSDEREHRCLSLRRSCELRKSELEGPWLSFVVPKRWPL